MLVEQRFTRGPLADTDARHDALTQRHELIDGERLVMPKELRFTALGVLEHHADIVAVVVLPGHGAAPQFARLAADRAFSRYR